MNVLLVRDDESWIAFFVGIGNVRSSLLTNI